MGTINLAAFGGLEYGTPKRELSEYGAQVSQNMQVLSTNFTPLREDDAPFNLSAVGTSGLGLVPVSSGTVIRTMFRYPYRDTGATTILGAGKSVDVVKSQQVNDTLERCYLADDGAFAPPQLQPHVLYLNGATPTVKYLGVPAPDTQMGLAAVGVAQLTATHLANVQAQNEAIVLQSLETMLLKSWGGTAASASTPGYLDHGAASDAVATGYNMVGDKPNQSRIFGIDGAGILFSTVGAEFFSWGLGVPYTLHTFTTSHEASGNAWEALAPGSTNIVNGGNFAAFSYRNFYPVYTFGTGGVYDTARAAIEAIVQPGVDPAAFLISSALRAELEARVSATFSATGADVAPYIARINFRRLLLTQLLDGRIGSTALTKLNYFLTNNASVQARITAAHATFASAVWEKLNGAVTSPANANTTYTGTTYALGATSVFNPVKATSLPYIINVARAMLSGDGSPSSSGDDTADVSPFISVRPTSRLKTFLDGEKLSLYNFAPSAAYQDAVFQASQTLDFTAELQALYNATTVEAMGDLADIPALFVQGGETTAAAIIGARDFLDIAIGDLETYYLGIPNRAKVLVREFFKEKGLNELHADVDPTGTQVLQSRYYTHTYVNAWGEESQDWAHWAGVVPTEVEIDQNDTVTLTLTGTVPTTYATITHWRIYRSNDASSATRYQLVAEVPIATTTFNDNLLNTALQEALTTEAWALPPTETVDGTLTYLQGLVNMPGNFMAGFIDRTVYFSEIGAPYAWPLEYAVPMEHRVVGMEVFGQTLVVLTVGGPYYVTGTDPASMSKVDTESNQACLSKRSIAKVSGGVVFASPNGICLASGQGVQVLLPAKLGKAYWDVFKPDLMQCAEFDGVLYIAAGDYGSAATGTNPDTGAAYPNGDWQRAIGINLQTMRITSLDLLVTAWYKDRTTDAFYGAMPHNGAIPQARKLMSAAGSRKGTWRSKRITLPMEDGFAWLQVMGEQSTASGYGALVKVYGYVTNSAGTEIETTLVNTTLTNTNPVRVGAGRFLEFEIEVQSKAQIKNLILAGSLEDLQGAT